MRTAFMVICLLMGCAPRSKDGAPRAVAAQALEALPVVAPRWVEQAELSAAPKVHCAFPRSIPDDEQGATFVELQWLASGALAGCEVAVVQVLEASTHEANRVHPPRLLVNVNSVLAGVLPPNPVRAVWFPPKPYMQCSNGAPPERAQALSTPPVGGLFLALGAWNASMQAFVISEMTPIKDADTQALRFTNAAAKLDAGTIREADQRFLDEDEAGAEKARADARRRNDLLALMKSTKGWERVGDSPTKEFEEVVQRLERDDDLELVRTLVAHAEPRWAGMRELLSTFIKERRPELVRLLLEGGAEAQPPARASKVWGKNALPLEDAFRENDCELVKLLLAHGAVPVGFADYQQSVTLWEYALRYNFCVEPLRAAGAEALTRRSDAGR